MALTHDKKYYIMYEVFDERQNNMPNVVNITEN